MHDIIYKECKYNIRQVSNIYICKTHQNELVNTLTYIAPYTFPMIKQSNGNKWKIETFELCITSSIIWRFTNCQIYLSSQLVNCFTHRCSMLNQNDYTFKLMIYLYFFLIEIYYHFNKNFILDIIIFKLEVC